jgi:hypothetical protein
VGSALTSCVSVLDDGQGPPLHAEMCASYGFDRRVGSAHLDMCRALPAEEVEQQFAGRSGDAGSGFASPCPNGPSGPRPLQLESCAAQSPGEEPGRAGDVAPQGLVHGRVVGSPTASVGSAYVLVVDEELVEVGPRRTHPMRKKPGGGPDRRVVLSQVKSLSASALARLSAKRPHAPGRTRPGPARWSCSRRTRCAAISRVVPGSIGVGACGPSSSSRSLSCARSTWSKNSVTSPDV